MGAGGAAEQEFLVEGIEKMEGEGEEADGKCIENDV